MINRIKTNKAPKAIGAYSQGVLSNNLVFTSGQIGIVPETGELIRGNFEKEVLQVLNNVSAVLEAGGSSIKSTIKLTVFLTDLSKFKIVNDVFIEFFNEKYPARSAVEVSGLPLNANIEIEAIGETL